MATQKRIDLPVKSRVPKDVWDDAMREALREAADHLDLDWTDDPVERAAGKEVSLMLRQRIDRAPLRRRFAAGRPITLHERGVNS